MAEKEKTEGLGVSGFTIGVLAIIFSGWVGLIMAIVGFIFCMVQQKRHKTGLAKVGIIINIIAAILSVVVVVLYTTVIAPLLNKIPAA